MPQDSSEHQLQILLQSKADRDDLNKITHEIVGSIRAERYFQMI